MPPSVSGLQLLPRLLRWWLLSGLASTLAAAESSELLRDPEFRQGLTLLAPKAADGRVGHLQPPGVSSPPVWELAQWHSRLPVTTTGTAAFPLVLTNAAKWVIVDPAPAATRLLLGVDSRAEYPDGPRQSTAEPWAHLLLQQAISDAPTLADLDSLRLRCEARLVETTTFRPAGYDPGLHAAQFQIVLTLNNTKAGTPGFGDFLWFVVPLYDDRHPEPPEYVARDFAMAAGKLIYNPGAAALGIGSFQPGVWQHIDCDLVPWLERALEAARQKGYLPHSRDPADHRIAHLNLGWEVPGLNRVTLELRGLRLAARRVPPGRAAGWKAGGTGTGSRGGDCGWGDGARGGPGPAGMPAVQ